MANWIHIYEMFLSVYHSIKLQEKRKKSLLFHAELINSSDEVK